ncbi:plasmid stabilization system protein ParE [Rhodopseudomonas rhenobacensis]|uniref:Plasmid stabilization system protein ParE n=1 Tax=Rhodopseudomonas rhenobacensis TaxID=87461 RepID=A0A7W7YZN4_9BRAD|nr:type II toxin-antitoxin system RelE/ParE family toxin [Rhodopseudomonas rhenobacensis]MBB5045309.1 plasmid stabilization system protein ParE [Rhodopseudomonas rhenobacensis]
MRVVFTAAALDDLDRILDHIAENFPTVAEPFRTRLTAVLARIGEWPQSAQHVADDPGVRLAPLIRYPYNVFYRVTADAVEILHIHHVARE